MFEDEVEELMCDYGLSPMNARSIAKELRKTKHALWMARARNANKCAILYEEGMEISEDTLFYVSASFADFMKPKWEWVERKCREKAKDET